MIIQQKHKRSIGRRGFLAALLKGLSIIPVISTAKATRVDTTTKVLPILDTRIAGFAYYDGPRVQPDLAAGQMLQLKREPGNPNDPRAIEIYWRGHKLGYIPRRDNKALSKLLDQYEQDPYKQDPYKQDQYAQIDAHITAVKAPTEREPLLLSVRVKV